MLRTKKDVDKHVQDLLKKVSNETERKSLGFNFGKLYYQIGEYKLAKQHLTSYLAVKECSAPGHRLVGQIAEALGDKEGAVRSYRRSYDLDTQQRDLVFKICTLLCELPSSLANQDLQRCWLERAEALQPKHSIVFELKQRLMLCTGGEVKGSIEEQLKSDTMTRPADMKLRIHLLKLYLDSNRIKEAYEHMLKIESLQVFSQELEWYNCALAVLEAFKKSSGENGATYHCHLLNTLERLAFLKTAQLGKSQKTASNIGEVISAVHSLDVALMKAQEAGVAQDVLLHFTRQLYFQVGLIALLRAQGGFEEDYQALCYATTLFALSYNQSIISSSSTSAEKKSIDSWVACATYSKSQCGHCIVAWEAKEGRKWVLDTVRKWNNPEGKRKIFTAAFSNVSSSDSFFGEKFILPKGPVELPAFSDLLDLDKTVLQLNNQEFHPIVWLGLQYFTMHRRCNETDFASDFSEVLMASRFLRDIPFSSASWGSCAPETLSALDFEAFVYATIFCTVSLEETKGSKAMCALPAALTKSLCSDQQATWWQAATKLISGSAKENLAELRRTLQRGLEVVRLSGNHHGVPLELVAKLARVFMARAGKARPFPAIEVPTPIATDVMSVEQTEALEKHAERYWKVFLDMVTSGNRCTPPLSGRLFEYRTAESEVDDLILQAKLYTGFQAWRNGRREEAQRYFQAITDPYASYYQGLLFKEMAEEELRKGASVYEARSAANILLNKAKDAFFITLDRLRRPEMDRFHPLDQKLAEVMEKVENKLSNLTNVSVANGHSTEEEESEKEFVTPTQVTSTPHRRSVMINSMRNGSAFNSRLDTSTRVEARPSPERLDAQLRQMVHRQDEFNKAVSEELREIKTAVVDIKILIKKLEEHLELQTKQENRVMDRKCEDKASEVYDDEDYGEEVEDWEVQQDEEEADIEPLARLKGKLKPVSTPGSQMSMPLYAPPFVPSATRPPYGFQQPFGPGFQAPGYQQYPGFPYSGMPGYPMAPTYAYQGGMPHWGIEAGASASPMQAYLPASGMAPQLQPPIQAPVQPAVPSHPQAQPASSMPSVSQSPASTSIFSRLGTKDGNSSLLAATLQQPAVTIPAATTETDSATAALRKLAANAASNTPASPAPHAYQISLPTQATPEKVVDTSLVPAIKLSTQNLLANIPEPKYSSVSASPDKALKCNRDRKASSCSDASNAPEEEVDNYPDFKPIIPLPEEVEVRTGEEGEEVLFDERCKLFRFADGEWKERGVGQLKLLQDPNTQKVRLVMRREQILKICANHHIAADMKLSDMKTAKNAWIWAAMDFADEEPKLEKFAVRFKTPEQAVAFKIAFEKAQQSDAARASMAKAPISSEEKPKDIQGFGKQFAPPSGSWACSIRYVNNKQDAIKCAACETPKPGCEAALKPSPSLQIKFGMPTASTSSSTSTTSTTSTSAIVGPFGTKTSTPTTGFQFGSASLSSSATTSTTTNEAPKSFSTLFGAQTQSAGFSFGTSSAMITTGATAITTSPFGGFKFGTTSPAGSTSTVASTTVTTTTGSTITTSTSPFGGFKYGTTSPPSTTSTVASTTTTSSPFAGFKFGVSSGSTTAAVCNASFTTASTAPTPTLSLGTVGITSIAPSVSPGTVITTSSVNATSDLTATSTSSVAFGNAKPSFSFTLPPTSGASSAATTKAPFTFSPPKLATTVSPAQPVGQIGTPVKAAVSSCSPAPLFGSTAFGTPKTTTQSLFGNLSFSSPAVTTTSTAKEVSEQKIADAKPSPFAAFSFGSTQPKDSTDKKTESGMLFSMLAQQMPTTGFNKSPDKEFPGAGTPLFSVKPAVSKADDKQADNEENENEGEEYEPNVAFEPVIPLPDLIDVTTGEEDESVLFSDRAFLFRFVSETKEWKEKGRGDMKILEHKTTGRARLLMRREQVLKVCCNHYITPQLSLKPLQTSDRTWTWSAQDFSEGELVQETFALRFKTAEQANKFKMVFENAQHKVGKSGETGKEKSEPIATRTPKNKPLEDLTAFKPKEGSWECQGCFLRNNSDVTKCPSCETLKPGTQTPVTQTPAPPTAAPTFKFGTDSGFKFGSSSSTTSALGSASSGFATSALGSGFNFTPSTPSSNQPQVKPRSPNVSASSDNEYYEEEAEDHIHFEPVIPLPDKVQVKTGEEDEEVVYCHRAKLFRLSDNEWKERGLGDIKILKHKITGKSRLLMRREQILKICLNHAITPELNFRHKDDKSWLWVAQDFAEGEPRLDTFVIRFKDAEIAKGFMKAVDENRIHRKDDVEIVHAVEATEEQQRKAKELMLPPNFFLYENAPPCPGCRGCEKIEEDSLTIDSVVKSETTTISTSDDSSKAPASTPFSFEKLAESKVSNLSFSSLASNTASGFNKPSTFSWSGAGQPIFVGATTTPASTKEKEQTEEDENDEAPENNDPHFEPIIPLPALVDVKTGEEDEEVLFSQRAKLYRFESSTKEWKEKGVGDMKILHHKEKNTYRILLRREQIHKLACNHWLTANMELRPMSTSTTAWTWFAMDFSQGELVSENFAVRFKTEDQALLFKTKFQECQAAVRSGKPDSSFSENASVPSSSGTDAKDREPTLDTMAERITKKTEEHDEDAEEREDEEEDEDEEYEDVEESIMFEKRCTLSCLEGDTWVLLGTGDLKIIYDDEMLCARIVVEDNNETLLCDNVIAIETKLEVNGKECQWSAIDYSSEETVRRTFRSQFSSNESALEFQAIFAEAKEFAEKSDVHDEPDLHVAGFGHEADDDEECVEGRFSATEEAYSSLSRPADCIRACDPNLAKALSEILSDIK